MLLFWRQISKSMNVVIHPLQLRHILLYKSLVLNDFLDIKLSRTAQHVSESLYSTSLVAGSRDFVGQAYKAVIGAGRAAIWATGNVVSATARDSVFFARGNADSYFYADAKMLVRQSIALSPLWLTKMPDWAHSAWSKTKSDLLALNEDWDVWTRWYDALLEGHEPESKAMAIARVSLSEAIWAQGPKVVNAEIKRLEEAERAAKADEFVPYVMKVGDQLQFVPEPHLPENTRPSWDYFLSYSTHDEAEARDICAIIESTGKTTFAQYKDIATGNNFVREMQRGLDGAGRVVALYSPHYEASGHCQAEWAAAYNADPSGAGQKLVPLLLQPTSLNALARQVVYKSLVGLADSARRDAVIEAITHRPQKRPPEILKAELAKLASPEARINEGGRLDAGPNRVFDKPLTTQDLAQLPAIQRELEKIIRDALPRNAPLVVTTILKAYGKHLLKHGPQPTVQFLDQLHSALDKEIRATGDDGWGAGLASLFESFSSNHALFRTHFPLANEEVFAETPVDELAATGDALAQPMENVAAAAQQAMDANVATSDFWLSAENSALLGRDLSQLPLDEAALDPKSMRVTVKRRYVLGTIGFLVTVYNLIGTTASIFSTPQGLALFQAVDAAIKQLMRLVQ